MLESIIEITLALESPSREKNLDYPISIRLGPINTVKKTIINSKELYDFIEKEIDPNVTSKQYRFRLRICRQD
mgnify:CR=1 FL=1